MENSGALEPSGFGTIRARWRLWEMRPARKKRKNIFCPLELWSACPTSTRQFSRRSSFDSAESTGTPNGFAVGRPTVLSTESNEDHHENWRVEVERVCLELLGDDQNMFYFAPVSIAKNVTDHRDTQCYLLSSNLSD